MSNFQKHNNQLESILKTKSNELQDINSLKPEAIVYNYKNNDEEYIKVIKGIENKIHDSLSDKKPFLKLAIFSLVHSMRNNPDKCTSLIYHNNDNQSKGDFNLPEAKWN